MSCSIQSAVLHRRPPYHVRPVPAAPRQRSCHFTCAERGLQRRASGAVFAHQLTSRQLHISIGGISCRECRQCQSLSRVLHHVHASLDNCGDPLPSRSACYAGLQGRTSQCLLRGILVGVGEPCHLVTAHDSQAQGVLVDALGHLVLLVPDASVLAQQRPLGKVLRITRSRLDTRQLDSQPHRILANALGDLCPRRQGTRPAASTQGGPVHHTKLFSHSLHRAWEVKGTLDKMTCERSVSITSVSTSCAGV